MFFSMAILSTGNHRALIDLIIGRNLDWGVILNND
ncbi:hypothetical protein MCECM63_01600 [Methylophilaceae bacterium]